jgi:hypothetical protein
MPKQQQCETASDVIIEPRAQSPVRSNPVFRKVVENDDEIRPMPQLKDMKSSVIRIEGTGQAVDRLPALIEEFQPTTVYVAFKGHPKIADARNLMARALRLIEKAGSNLPDPLVVGLEDIDPAWQNDFQIGMVMDGISGFFRDGAPAYAKRFSSEFIDPATTSWVSRSRKPDSKKQKR